MMLSRLFALAVLLTFAAPAVAQEPVRHPAPNDPDDPVFHPKDELVQAFDDWYLAEQKAGGGIVATLDPTTNANINVVLQEWRPQLWWVHNNGYLRTGVFKVSPNGAAGQTYTLDVYMMPAEAGFSLRHIEIASAPKQEGERWVQGPRKTAANGGDLKKTEVK